jgi:hypothetical protein
MKRAFRRAATPLAFYYAVTLVLPLANGAGGPVFLRHALVVLVVPPALVLLFSVARSGRNASRTIIRLLWKQSEGCPNVGSPWDC